MVSLAFTTYLDKCPYIVSKPLKCLITTHRPNPESYLAILTIPSKTATTLSPVIKSISMPVCGRPRLQPKRDVITFSFLTGDI